MSTKFRFLLTAIALLSTGCAAPMTELVADRQSGTINQHLFKEGDEVWVTYQDRMDTVQTKRGFVLDTDDDSVRMNVGQNRSIDIEYRQVHTLSHPVKDRWFVGLSGGTFYTLLPVPQELPHLEPLSAIGISSRFSPYSNTAFEANFSVGKGRYLPTRLIMSLNFHTYTLVPRTYFFLGVGWVWDKQLAKLYFPRPVRLGLGVTTIEFKKRFNVRIEAEVGSLIGTRIYFEGRRLHKNGSLELCKQRKINL